jgi:hypothetical protein
LPTLEICGCDHRGTLNHGTGGGERQHAVRPGNEASVDQELSVPGAADMAMAYNAQVNARSNAPKGTCAMTEYLIAAILFVAIVTTLVYLWKREHS